MRHGSTCTSLCISSFAYKHHAQVTIIIFTFRQKLDLFDSAQHLDAYTDSWGLHFKNSSQNTRHDAMMFMPTLGDYISKFLLKPKLGTAVGGVAEWNIELSPHDLQFKHPTATKDKVLPDF